MEKKLIVLIPIGLMLVLLISGCIEESKELNDVSVNLKWLHQAQFAGNYVAEAKGYYKDEGINISILRGGVDSPAIARVLSGEADFGIAGADDLIVSIDNGEPIKAIAAIYKLSPVVYFSLSESNITTPYDFVNKTIGIKPGTGTDYSYIAMLGKLNINRSEITEVDVGYDLSLLYNGDVAVWPGFRINEPHVAEQAGYNVSLIRPEDWGVIMYADVLFTTLDFIDENPEIVEGFVKATLKGWEYAIENEEETIDITMNYVEDDNREHQEFMLSESIPLIHTGTSKLGYMKQEIWESIINILILNEVISTEPSIESIYTNEFIE